VLVISPHPDDDVIGCGGTLCKHRDQGDRINVIYLTSGEKGCRGAALREAAMLREQEAKEATKIIGIKKLDFWRQPDRGLSASTEIVHQLRTKLRELHPDIVYVTHDREAHHDHRVAANIVKKSLSTKNVINPPCVYMFEVWTPLQKFSRIVDISNYIEIKMAAIKAHKSQCEQLCFAEAFGGLNRYRGELFCCSKGGFAEVFLKMDLL
jgi:LmbE family N-acetylglucosaminyl deacetylase